MDNVTDIISFLAKAGMLILIAFYIIFSAVIFLNVRRLNVFVTITYANLSGIIQLLYLIHLLLVISLFFLALVIL